MTRKYFISRFKDGFAIYLNGDWNHSSPKKTFKTLDEALKCLASR